MANTELAADLVPDPTHKGTVREENQAALYEHRATGFHIVITERYVVHGLYDGKAEEPATLLVYAFRLKNLQSDRDRRFRSFTVELQLENEPSRAPKEDPFIKCYAPGRFDAFLAPTPVHRSKEKTTGGAAKAGGGVAGGEASVEFTREQKEAVEWEQLRKVRLTANAYTTRGTRGGGRQGQDKARWTINEDDAGEKIPDEFAVGLIVRRSTADRFKVTWDFKAKVDVWYKAAAAAQNAKETLFGKAEKFKIYDHTVSGTSPVDKSTHRDFFTNKPEDLKDPERLKSWTDGNNLDELTYVHLAEQISQKFFYRSDETPPTSNDPPIGN